MKQRAISKSFQGVPTIEGAGVHLKRAFGYHQAPLFNPFLMLDDFHTSNPDEYLAGFPWHPHRGIETITYILEGRVEHADSMGNRGVIGAGDVQWMTAGSGIIHQEMPQRNPGGAMWGFQFWANLPAASKMMPPRYRDVPAAAIPQVTLENGVSAKVIAGRVAGVQGPVADIVIDPELLDVTVPPGAAFEHAVPEGHTLVVYVMSGKGDLGEGRLFGPETAVLFERQGDGLRATGGEQGVRFLVLAGRPLNEPIAWQGPIVMNTPEELRVAFEEFHNGTFVR